MPSIKISAVIIAFNEERNIARCIDSLAEIVDEVVVVDSYSTDSTRSICEAKGVKFVCHEFEGHIQQKNWAITQASYPYVLSLDADEALSETLRASILTVKENWQADGYTFNRLNNYCGQWIKHGGWYPDKKLRLWDKTKGKWGGKNPHDTFIMKPNTQTKHLEGDLLHYSYYHVEEHRIQSKKFARIAAKSYAIHGKKAPLYKVFFSPLVRFVSGYFIQLGFLDGYYGWVIAGISYKETKLKYKLLRASHRTQ